MFFQQQFTLDCVVTLFVHLYFIGIRFHRVSLKESVEVISRRSHLALKSRTCNSFGLRMEENSTRIPYEAKFIDVFRENLTYQYTDLEMGKRALKYH